ncbi:MAG TPA: agmatine deiminase family protein [Candidatus Xenobia bacterium]|nr:agmatine deiminase family protein [Candidatus Xenobia bacterium]
MPAEWERHEATWLGWPHNRSDWPGKFAAIPWVYCEIVRHLAPGERVRILVNDRAHEAAARAALEQSCVDLARVEFFRVPTNRGWTRDFGPIFVRRARPREVAVARFRFNAWARYPDWRKDNRVAGEVARRLGLRRFRVQVGGRDFVLEGGAIDVNGRGTLLTTEECLLDQRTQPRNPGLGRKQVEAVLRSVLGVSNILWLGRGLAGDDTHGHVDDFCRFVNPRTVVLCEEKNRRDPNYRALEENRERLRGMRLENGARVEVARLPMPAPRWFGRDRLPASYANFYIANAAVLVPTFNDPNDRAALGILAELFRDRPVVGIHAVDLVLGLGTLHCLTQQQPAL